MFCTGWEVQGLTEELFHSWGRTAVRHDVHMCVYCSFSRFEVISSFLLPVPASDKLQLLDKELNCRLWKPPRELGSTLMKSFPPPLFLPEMHLLLSSTAGPNYLVCVWEISATGKGLFFLSIGCGSDSKQEKRSKAHASV